MDQDAAVFVSGSKSMLGAALVEELRSQGFEHLIGLDDEPPADDADALDVFFSRERPAYVFVAGGRSAGIQGNIQEPAGLMLDNVVNSFNVIGCARKSGATGLLYFGSSCCYPRACAQPMREHDLFTGRLEPTSEAYGIAKLAAMKFCDAVRQECGARFMSAIPADMYGPWDHFDEAQGHVVPALMRRMHEAREQASKAVTVWGSGAPVRDFIYVRDVARGAIQLMREYHGESPVNITAEQTTTIAHLAAAIKRVVGYEGEIRFDLSRPDGAPEKRLDGGQLRGLGWCAAYSLDAGLKSTCEWFLRRVAAPRPADS